MIENQRMWQQHRKPYSTQSQASISIENNTAL